MVKAAYLLIKFICKQTRGSRHKVGEAKKDQRRDKIKDLVEVIKKRKNVKNIAETIVKNEINKIVIQPKSKSKNKKSKENKDKK